MRLRLQDATQEVVVEEVESFVGEDASGSFGILPSHDRFLTCLDFGMARYRVGGIWAYLAVPGAVLRCDGEEIVISCRHFVTETDYSLIRQALEHRLMSEEQELRKVKGSLQRLEDELLKRLMSRES